MEEQQLIDEGYIDGKKSFEALSKNILEHFDFEKVYQTMKALDWHWDMGDERYGIPSIDTLKKKAYRLLSDVYEAGKGSISTGGFSVGWDGGNLWINFSIECAHTSDF